ncbi:sugar transferase [Mediterraneibacter gnavus]|jgi:lipopolysaccharide/colanic/teichoic acid biosynthesis glycosyltransferase/glycosyltransferase involved in cell wall biosynthesis|uniref:Sugar transferase n=1 Tax=Mediterraneibacter gnavus TaxID=33038 RepID=A0A9Q4HYV5_MEDGN|nr:sugar transferase [Mediterraneibacter gnavus]MCZ0668480.1 sugar transferase [Mediterraneibacter gnavus]MCZ0688171.1 sugar transferase [Mediterraneibacter gnavus]MCZ0693631.1 sugar transferase [Mediterraneibacter gnavus]
MTIDVKKVVEGIIIAVGVSFVGLNIIAKKNKSLSIYDNEKEQKNPLEGKKVIFIEDENDQENADGVRGHLKEIGISNYYPSFYEKYTKRLIDLVLSFCGLVVLSPIMGIIALAIKMEDPGPVLFTQKRIGKNKQYFKLHKFRSMKMSTPHDVPTHMLDNPEQYITKVGKFLRAHSLDELPQIWDIFIGNMSIIGPRPGLWNQDVLTAERDRYNANDIRPGLTGWAQINGRDELEISDKAKLDGEYCENMGLRMDAKVFFKSIGVLGGDNSVVEGGTGELKKNEQSFEKKKILVICQYYKPEPFRISDICEEMVRRGHEVQVVTGYPNYPEGILYEGYGKNKHIDEVINGVKVHRCYTVPRHKGSIKRLMNYYSYVVSSTKHVISKECVASDGKSFDIVFCNQLSPVMMAIAAIAYKKKYKIPVVMYCLDLWPESLIAGGITRKSIVYKYFHYVSKKIYRQMDKILITSRMFSGYLEEQFGIPDEKIEYLPQYAEGIFEEIPARKEDGKFNFMFAGNIGSIQSVETVIKTAEILKEYPVIFHIVGSGSDLERLQEIGKKMKNVVFYGRRPIEEMPEFYAKADAMLVTLAADPILSLTLPGKVQSYMAVGKPIIGAIDGEARFVIEDAKCGFCGKSENAEELAENIKKFIKADNKIEMGRNARRYYEENFEEKLFMDKLESKL